jgi:DNA mismatch repair ATPase MutS
MKEAAFVLSSAGSPPSSRSLVLIDELGRGCVDCTARWCGMWG